MDTGLIDTRNDVVIPILSITDWRKFVSKISIRTSGDTSTSKTQFPVGRLTSTAWAGWWLDEA